MSHSLLPLFVAIPLGSAFLISLLGKKVKRFPDLWVNLTTFCLLCISLYSIRLLNDCGALVYEMGGWKIPFGIGLVLDGLSGFVMVTVNLVAFLVTVYSINYMEHYTAKWKFYTLFLLMLAGMNGVVVTGDMFNLFVFLEIASVASYALVAYGTEHEEVEAAFKYMVMGTIASLLVLFGIALLYGYTSTLNMADMGRVLAEKGGGKLVFFVATVFLVGFGLKAALMPFHAWLPDAHPSAPAPISAMLSGVLIKAIGVYALCRVLFNVIGVTVAGNVLIILMVLGTVSMAAGALLALGQKDFKRLLAYSSISQVGYIFFAIGLGTPLGFLGGLFHLINHAVFKSLLFLNSGAIVYSTGNRDLEKMGGLNERMPVTGTTSVIGSMSIAGIPPFAGFFSKLVIIIAAVQADRVGFAVIAVLVSIITIAYYLKAQKMAFFGALGEAWKDVKEAPVSMCVSMVILAILCVGLGLLMLPGLRSVFLQPAVEVLNKGTEYSQAILGILEI